MTYTEAVLLALLIISNAWWGWHVQKLVNKILSRSYYEYKQAEKVGARRPPPKAPQPATPPSQETAQVLGALDQMRAQFMPFSGGQ